MSTLINLNSNAAWQRNQRRLTELRLRQAELLVAEGEKYIIKHRNIVELLERKGQDAAPARQVMYTLEKAQLRHTIHRDRLLVKLSNFF